MGLKSHPGGLERRQSCTAWLKVPRSPAPRTPLILYHNATRHLLREDAAFFITDDTINEKIKEYMVTSIFILLAGLVLIVGGANILTDGASALARRWGVPDMVIGLTIVAFGTSAPEFVISVTSAATGNPGLAIGNVVGSNLFNILVIVGLVAVLRPVGVGRSLMAKEIPLVVLSSAAVLICGNDVWLDGSAENMVDRTDGLLMLLFFVIFMRYTLSMARSGDKVREGGEGGTVKRRPAWAAWLMVSGGLGGLIWGGSLFVDGATGVARGLGVSESVIGLTIVAIGTSLPDLAASVAAAVKGSQGLAIGNVVGSCVFNVFFVLGSAATVSPLPLGGITDTDLSALLGASVLFWLFGWLFRRRTITRLEGAVMVAAYAAYMVYLCL